MTSTSIGSAAASSLENATSAALAKATAKLAADRKAGASDTVLRADQAAILAATKAAQKTSAASSPAGKGAVNTVA